MQDPIHALFNQKTVQRICSDIILTDIQRKSAFKWLELLRSKALEDEKTNYIKFAHYILEDVLGYPINEIDHEKHRVEFSFRDQINNKGVCIEAKGTSVKDLFAPQHRVKREQETPIKQTWDLIGNGNFDYGITTNYKHFILIDKSKGYSKYHFFDFQEIDKDQNKLKEFVAVFSKEKILDEDFIPQLYEQSVSEEREITKHFYKLYHETRLMLIKEFISNNNTKDNSIHYAQLILNRLVFIFFAEDNGKLRKNLFSDLILQSLNIILVSDESKLVSDTIVNLFELLDKGSQKPIKIFGFNGGLFKEKIPCQFFFKDKQNENFFMELLLNFDLKKIQLNESAHKILTRFDNLSPIIRNMLLLSSFNFESELNVNILGHIFEQSLTDLDELKKEEKLSTQKIQGIYYTPEYITDYICRNTIIPYLSKSNSTSSLELLTEYKDNIEELERKFIDLKIIDISCGSGAFLIKAVDVLLDIYQQIQKYKESLGYYTLSTENKKSSLGEYTLMKWQEHEVISNIIENNIFGIDINEESVEITKLSLFLKLASNNRKLIDLSNNIKVGNSLVDDITIDKKAFCWNAQFKEIIEKEGFDIVIGNPPYVRQERLSSYKQYFRNNYKSFFGTADLFVYFISLKENGLLGFIVSNKWSKSNYGKNIRSFLLDNTILQFIDFGDLQIFENAQLTQLF